MVKFVNSRQAQPVHSFSQNKTNRRRFGIRKNEEKNWNRLIGMLAFIVLFRCLTWFSFLFSSFISLCSQWMRQKRSDGGDDDTLNAASIPHKTLGRIEQGDFLLFQNEWMRRWWKFICLVFFVLRPTHSQLISSTCVIEAISDVKWKMQHHLQMKSNSKESQHLIYQFIHSFSEWPRLRAEAAEGYMHQRRTIPKLYAINEHLKLNDRNRQIGSSIVVYCYCCCQYGVRSVVVGSLCPFRKISEPVDTLWAWHLHSIWMNCWKYCYRFSLAAKCVRA